jgi:hypothetical protein
MGVGDGWVGGRFFFTVDAWSTVEVSGFLIRQGKGKSETEGQRQGMERKG